MFYYYGSKTLLSKHYPPPLHDLIIEPFAGSGAYSLYWLGKNKNIKSILVEKDPRVYSTWKYLLEKATVEDIENYPVPKIGDKTSDFLIMTCAVSNAISKCKELKYTERLAKVFEIQKRRLIKYLPLGNRVEIINDDYRVLENKKATWFIDPPYQITKNVNKNTIFANGNGYGKGFSSDEIDFEKLGEWCKERKGQVIVCEKEGADWMNFRTLKNGKTSMGKNYKEVFWTNE